MKNFSEMTTKDIEIIEYTKIKDCRQSPMFAIKFYKSKTEPNSPSAEEEMSLEKNLKQIKLRKKISKAKTLLDFLQKYYKIIQSKRGKQHDH